MITGFLHLHSTLRWVVLALLLITFVKAAIGLSKNSTDFGSQGKLGLFTMIALHIQLVIGLTLFFDGHWSEYTLDGITRFFMMEHTPMMIIAIVLGTLGHSLAKRATDVRAKFKKQTIFFGISLLLVFGMIPWPFMRNFGELFGWI
ncbi:MAG TPA: cytochrome B [Flavobacteriales bacterium]|nr:cytochrome B [Flavobacteriales bacterium]